MSKYDKKGFLRVVFLMCLATVITLSAVISSSGEGFMGFGRRNADEMNPPPIAEGIEDGANNGADKIESGANDIIEDIKDGGESFADGIESDIEEGLETNIPDTNIEGAVHETAPSAQSSDNTEQNEGGMAGGATLGIVIALLVVAAVIVLIFALKPKKKH